MSTFKSTFVCVWKEISEFIGDLPEIKTTDQIVDASSLVVMPNAIILQNVFINNTK